MISRDGPTRKCATSIPTANHVNNAVFASMLETGRVELLYNPDRPLADPEGSFVIVDDHRSVNGGA